ncbi:MAG: hypothetical protein HN730_02045 [Bdellovibrionales bacterium]|nr:hypothetical protein [Bdellovibrionales bacterium]
MMTPSLPTSSGRSTVRAPIKSELIVGNGKEICLGKSSNISSKGILFQIPKRESSPPPQVVSTLIKLPSLSPFDNSEIESLPLNFDHQVLRVKIEIVRTVTMAPQVEERGQLYLAGNFKSPTPEIVATLTSLVEIYRDNMEYLLKMIDLLQQDRDLLEKIFFYSSQLGYINLPIEQLKQTLRHDYHSIKIA